ncbi:MAG TPA: TonB C-terminal domain-containing protein [Sandaracinaceae bacterium LLY-WYZ-13_1]|nr:TonB C-terminal domain-containing protein [Sandaracinaceae bacterium LLY-WYZ-13_1]
MDAATQPMRFDPLDGRPESALGGSIVSVLELVGGAAALVLIPLFVAAVIGVLALSNAELLALLVAMTLVFAILVVALIERRVLPVVGGVLAVLLFPVGAGGLLWGLGAGMTAVSELDDEEAEPERVLEEEDVIEARFVRLGRDFEDELPNREVPLLNTAPQELSEVPTEDTPDEVPEEVERPEEQPPDAVVDDQIRDLVDRAEAFSEIAEERELEGDPEGIEEGTETEATEGDIYRGRLYSFFKRGWTVPTTLDDDVVSELTAVARIQIGQNLEIVSFELQRESGNPLFDQSVLEQLTRLQAAGQHIPPPPEEVADQYVGQAIAVRFHGRQAG